MVRHILLIMIRTQVYFEEEHRDELMKWARLERRKFSEILREIVAKAVRERNGTTKKINLKNWNKFMGAGGGTGDKYLSRDVDKILYVDPYK